MPKRKVRLIKCTECGKIIKAKLPQQVTCSRKCSRLRRYRIEKIRRLMRKVLGGREEEVKRGKNGTSNTNHPRKNTI